MVRALLSAMEQFSPEAYLTACKWAVETGDSWRVRTMVEEAESCLLYTSVTLPKAEHPIAFAANQRDEVRDLHDVAGALSAQPGMEQQTFVAGFSAGAGASAGSIAYSCLLYTSRCV